MKNIFFVFCIFLFSFVSGSDIFASNSSDSDLDEVRKAFVDATVASYALESDVVDEFIECSDYGKANDVLLMQLYMAVHLPDAEVKRLLDLFDFERGYWKDIDYASGERGRWPASLHVTRMYSLAKLYAAGPEQWKSSERLNTLLHKGMQYWFSTMPVCPNWWHNEIGVPKKMGAILLVLRDELSEAEINGGLRVLDRSTFGLTGQNKAALAGNILMKGLLLDDEALVIKARDTIAEEICLTESEGMQDDWSFHQHGPQMQMGNYGLAYADGMAFWFRVLSGTKYMFSDEQTELFSHFVKDGLCWSIYKGIMDPSFCGRQVFIDAGRGKVLSFAILAQNMAAAFEQEAEFYNTIAMENLYPAGKENSIVGAKFFPRSDCGVYRTKGWYSSVRMHSKRTIGFEFINNENTLANFSADGAVLLMQDSDEYDNIFACWDWRKVPGVTAYDDGNPIKREDTLQGKRNNSEQVGGVTAETSAGDVMVASMELQRDGLHALKSAFFFKDCIVALGSDINIANPDFKDVTTAIDQTRLLGEVTLDESAIATDSDTFTGAKWVHHNNRSYVSLDENGINVSKAVQEGKWDDIEPSFKDNWDAMPIFKCWLQHPTNELAAGGSSSYAYAVLPCASVSDTKSFVEDLAQGKASVKVLVNTDECQAVSYGGVICAVVHKAGNYELDGEPFNIDKPCIIIKDGDYVKTENFVEDISSVAGRVFERAKTQFELLDQNLTEAEETASKSEKLYPRTLSEDGKLETTDLNWWCSGFYPGSLWFLYEYTGENKWKDLALKYTLPLEPLKFETNNHDIGFQIMSSFGNALRLTGNKEYEPIIKDAAKSLASRFSDIVGCTKSWDINIGSFPYIDDNKAFLVIIDNMMNLELLLAGAILSGDENLKNMAVSHAETTMKNHFRKDYSSFHLVNYNSEDGHVNGKQTVQGYSDSSAWSRGQAWGLYGYTMVYRFTKDVKFLEQATNIAEYLLPRLPEDGIPYWDYDTPDIPDDYRDASAGAIMASALLELSGYVNDEKSSRYQNVAKKIIRTLASDEYMAQHSEINGFLLKHSVGNKPGDSEVDVPLTYADYYFLEALLRYVNN